jgi:ABC-type spermidine/putrescine transport system permease subunit I
MKEHEIDRILSEEEILPSSRFTASVMDAVRREAAAPPPIPFPWTRALPGIVAATAVLVTIVVMILLRPPGLGAMQSPSPWLDAFAKSLTTAEWRSVGLAVLVTFLSLLIPVRAVLRHG